MSRERECETCGATFELEEGEQGTECWACALRDNRRSRWEREETEEDRY